MKKKKMEKAKRIQKGKRDLKIKKGNDGKMEVLVNNKKGKNGNKKSAK